jgi:anaerobic selenocysteine-containing dehydrogenase
VNDDGELVILAPDRSHPVSKGFACHKGLKSIDVHNDPDRLNTPLKRINRHKSASGQFVPLSWEDSFTEVSKGLKDTIGRHGTIALSAYL